MKRLYARVRRDRLLLYVQQDSAVLCHLRGRLRPRLEKQDFYPLHGKDWPERLQTLAAGVVVPSTIDLEVVLSSALTRFVMLPWDSSLVDQEARLSLARLLFERQYAPDRTGDYRFTLAPPHFGAPQVAVAVEASLFAALEALAPQWTLRLGSMQPLLSKAWMSYRRRLEGEQGTLVLAEPQRLLCASYRDGHIHDVHYRPVTASTLAPILKSLTEKGGVTLLTPVTIPALVGSTVRQWALPGGMDLRRDPQRQADYAWALCGERL